MHWIRYCLILCVGICSAQTSTPQSLVKQSGPPTSSQVNQLIQPSPTPVVPEPNRYDPAKIEAVNELHDYQIKDLLVKVSDLESSRTWIIGLSAGLGIGVGLVVWLRKDIVSNLVKEAFPSNMPPTTRPDTWYPSRAQWIVIWITAAVTTVLTLGRWSNVPSLRIGLVALGWAVLLLLGLRSRK